jgi:hypothetical protein
MLRIVFHDWSRMLDWRHAELNDFYLATSVVGRALISGPVSTAPLTVTVQFVELCRW